MIKLLLMSCLLLTSCVHQTIKLPKTVVTPSENYLREQFFSSTGANFFNEEEDFERLLAAKRLGINWVRLSPSKWKSSLYPEQQSTFLVGPKDKKYSGLIKEDLDRLLTVLGWAHELELKVVLTFLTVPGRVFAQHNGGKQDERLWLSFDMQDEAIQFFTDVALYVGHHPALIAINPINEPAPETVQPAFNDWHKGDYLAWYRSVEGSPRDLNQFYERVVTSMRKARNRLPIMLDAGLFAHPSAFVYLKPVDDPYIFYSFHWYMPFVYSQRETNYSYPGLAPIDEQQKGAQQVLWNKARLEEMLAPVVTWARSNELHLDRVVVGEYGVNRLMPGAKEYLADSRALFKQYGFMHALYGFREQHFARMDYELGARQKIYPYWQALEQHVTPHYGKISDNEFLDVLGLKPLALKASLKGISTWNWFGPSVNQQLVHELMDACVKNGLLKNGYDTIMLDGGWRATELENNVLVADKTKFPEGIKKLVDRAHALGFKFGLHIPVGTKDCAQKTAGTFGLEEANAKQIKDWGVDIVKLDQCVLDESEQWPADILRSTYAQWHEELQGSNIEIIASASRYYGWYPKFANYGRVTLDLRPKIFGGARFSEPFLGEFLSVIEAARQSSEWYFIAKDNYRNDPDMLVVDNGLSLDENRSHFAIWAMLGGPLLLSLDPRTMSEETLRLVTNPELLAIHRDTYEPARLIKDEKDVLIFRKRMREGQTALLIVNLDEKSTLTRTFSYQELDVQEPTSITSVFADKPKAAKTFTTALAPHACTLLVVK